MKMCIMCTSQLNLKPSENTSHPPHQAADEMKDEDENKEDYICVDVGVEIKSRVASKSEGEH